MTAGRDISFQLDRELGAGATGKVHHGTLLAALDDLPAGFEIAVKYLHPERQDQPEARAAFELEAAAASAVQHSGLVRCLATGSDERGSYIAMQFVPGRTLREVLLESGPLPEPQVRSVGEQLAGALAALHAAGYRHGDVKPENMRLDEEGRAVLLDLGFAQPLAQGAGPQALNPGSLAYLAPEQARGEAADGASDLFSLALVLYELASGHHPFLGRLQALGAESPADSRASSFTWRGFSSGHPLALALEEPDADHTLAAMAQARFQPPSRVMPQLSPLFDALLEEALQRDPRRRSTPRELERRLKEGEAGEWWRARLDLRADGSGPKGREARPHLTPLVGREPEMRTLLEAYEGRRGSDAGGLVWLSGEHGSGKSRLVTEFVDRVRASDEPPMFLYGRCRELPESRPCQPILRLLSRFLHLPLEAAAGRRERELLAELVAPQIAETLTLSLDPHFEGSTPVSVPVALIEWLRALGRRVPLVVFLDDVNWAGPATLDVITRLVERLDESNALYVLGLREKAGLQHPEALERLRATTGEQPRVASLELTSLDEEAVSKLVASLFHRSVPRLHLAQVLWQRSRGNPGMLAEILRGLIERDQARPSPEDPARLVLGIEPDELPLPGSLNKIIADSYRQLPVPDQLWLRRLAIIGGRIHIDFLMRAFPNALPAEIQATLARLVSSGWLVPTGDRYRFARPAQREAVYRSLSPATRRELHSVAARALKSKAGEPLRAEDAFQRAFHLRAAEEHRALIGLVQPLLKKLLERGQPQRVHSLSLWGLQAIDALKAPRELNAVRIRLLEAAADAADRLGERRNQRELLDQLSDLDLDPQRDAESLGRVYLLHGRYAESVGQYGLARGLLRNAAELLRTTEASKALSDALRRLATVQAHVGELKQARELAREALSRAHDAAGRGRVHIVLANLDLLEGSIESALRCVDRALKELRRSERLGSQAGFALAYLMRARGYRAGGRPARALAAAQRAIRLAHQAGERRLEAESGARLGQLLLDLDRSEEAEARLREALRLSTEIEDRRGRALAGAFLGVLLAESDDPTATATIERACALAQESGLNRLEAFVRAIRARIHLQAGELEAARQEAEQALELLERFGAELADRLVISATYVLLLYETGKKSPALRRIKALRRELRRQNQRIGSGILRQRHRRATTRLLEAALTPEGPLFPRVRLRLDHSSERKG